jgi:hypothetical protein
MSVVYIYGLIDPRNELIIENVRYVGKTKRTIEDRYKQHLRDSEKYLTSLYFWMNKLLKEDVTPKAFKIDECDESNWRECEKKYIAQYRQFGNLLNVSDGGEGIEDESRWVVVYQYDEFGVYVKKHNSVAIAGREMKVTPNSIFASIDQNFSKSSCGYYWFSSEEKAKKFDFKRPRQRYVPILAYDLKGNFVDKFLTISEASLKLKIHEPNIIRSLSSNNKHYAGNLFWFYENNVPEKILPFINKKPRHHNLSAVEQFTKEGVFIQDYISIRNASEVTKVSEDSIGMSARGLAKSGGGFVWKYKNN